MPKWSDEDVRKKAADALYLNKFARGTCRKCLRGPYVIANAHICLECYCRDSWMTFEDHWGTIIQSLVESKREILDREVAASKDESAGLQEVAGEYRELVASYNAKSYATVREFFAGRLDYLRDKFALEGMPRADVDFLIRSRFGIPSGVELFERLLGDLQVAFAVKRDRYVLKEAGP